MALSCNPQSNQPSATAIELNNDRLSQLPDDIMLLILSSFTMKEAATTCLVSRQFKYFWALFPKLNFVASKLSLEKIDWINHFPQKVDRQLLEEERSEFIKWVNRVVDEHLGLTLDEFRVAFELDNSCQSHIDRWVDFALVKLVKTLILDFTPISRSFTSKVGLNQYRFPLECCVPRELSGKWVVVNQSLTSLHFTRVHLSAEVVELLLHFFVVLENLCIEWCQVTCIKASDPLPRLKFLEVTRCDGLKSIDISVPKLSSFRYRGAAVELRFKNASLLSEVYILHGMGPSITHTLESLSDYMHQLEYLKLLMFSYMEKNAGINFSPALMNLKHLEMIFHTSSEQIISGWIPLIKASPVLQKFTVQVDLNLPVRWTRTVGLIKRCGDSLKSLKTLEFVGFLGVRFEIDLLRYVIENATLLDEVIVNVNPEDIEKSSVTTKEYAMNLQANLPDDLRFIVR